MSKSEAMENKPLWLVIEEGILAMDSSKLAEDQLEASILEVAGALDEAGLNVTHHGGNRLALRWAMVDAVKNKKPFLEDFNASIRALSLDTAQDAFGAASKIIDDLGADWPKLKEAARRSVVIQFVEDRKQGLLIEKAKGMDGDLGIRLLIEEEMAPEVITEAMGITEEKFVEVRTQMEKEQAERDRVAGLLEAVADKSDEEKVKHLFDKDVSEELIIEMAGVSQAAIDSVKKALEEALKEKQRLEEEAAAKKKAEAEGPSLDAISPEDMLDYIEAVREIMEFSDVEKEIRVMCEQSSIPKALVDIAVTDPDKLDEMEKQAEG